MIAKWAQEDVETLDSPLNNKKYQMHSVLCKFRKLLTIQNTAL